MSATVLYMSISLDGFVAGPNEGLGKGSARPLGSAIKALLNLRILVRSLHVSLQCRTHLYRASRLDRRMKQHSRRCPSLRGPTPTRPLLARQRRSLQPTLIQGYGAANCPRTAYGTKGFDVIWRCHNLLDRRRSYGQPAPGAGAGAVSN